MKAYVLSQGGLYVKVSQPKTKALAMLTALELLIVNNNDLDTREQLIYSKMLRQVKADIRPVKTDNKIKNIRI